MTAGDRLRAAIIGAGWIAERHVPLLDSIADVELVAACDLDRTRARAIAEPRGARAYDRWEELLEREQLDLLWVCTPPLAHRGPAVEALERGIHVYLEKPLARDVSDGEAIEQAANRSDAICAIAYQWHALDLLDGLHELIAGQTVGLLVGRNYGPTAGRSWFVERSQGGGQIFERASHHIDLQRAIAGDVIEVSAVAGTVALASGDASARVHPDAIEHVGTLSLRFASGALGAIQMAWTSDRQPHSYGVDVLATDATLTLELGPDTFALQGTAAGKTVRVTAPDPFAASARRFLQAARLRDRSLVACTPADALATLRVADACELALATGDPTTVSN
jgi:predicted dehydrogenase